MLCTQELCRRFALFVRSVRSLGGPTRALGVPVPAAAAGGRRTLAGRAAGTGGARRQGWGQGHTERGQCRSRSER